MINYKEFANDFPYDSNSLKRENGQEKDWLLGVDVPMIPHGMSYMVRFKRYIGYKSNGVRDIPI